VVIYGAGSAGRQLVQSLRHGAEFEPVAFVDDAPNLKGAFIQGLKVYSTSELSRLIKDYGIEKVLLAIPSAPPGAPSRDPASAPIATVAAGALRVQPLSHRAGA